MVNFPDNDDPDAWAEEMSKSLRRNMIIRTDIVDPKPGSWLHEWLRRAMEAAYNEGLKSGYVSCCDKA